MLLRALLVVSLAAALVTGCSGDDSGEDASGSSSEPAALPSSFAEIVRAGLIRAGLDAEPATDLELTAEQGPNKVHLDLREAFERYEEESEARDEIVADVVADVQERLETGIGEQSLEGVRDDLMPLLKPTFAVRRFGFEAAETAQPAGLKTVYAVDAEDAFTIVRPEDVERWETTVEEIEEIALDNLLRQTNEDEPLLCEPSDNQSLCGWASGDGYDATRMIVPELRRQIEREYDGAPVAYAVPEEHIYVALPLATLRRAGIERPFRLKLRRDYQISEDPLSPEVFVEENGKLVVLK